MGSSFLLCCALRAVFAYANAFNQDMSNWNTGAVTSMYRSKCTLPLCVCTMPSVFCVFNMKTQVLSDHKILMYCFFVVFGMVLFVVVVVVVAVACAVFMYSYAFNQDVSKWNTGAVTTMNGSKCTLPLCVCTMPSVFCVFNMKTQVLSDHKILMYCFFVVFGMVLFGCCCCCCCCVRSVSRRMGVQSGRVKMEYRCGDNYEWQ